MYELLLIMVNWLESAAIEVVEHVEVKSRQVMAKEELKKFMVCGIIEFTGAERLTEDL